MLCVPRRALRSCLSLTPSVVPFPFSIPGTAHGLYDVPTERARGDLLAVHSLSEAVTSLAGTMVKHVFDYFLWSCHWLLLLRSSLFSFPPPATFVTLLLMPGALLGTAVTERNDTVAAAKMCSFWAPDVTWGFGWLRITYFPGDWEMSYNHTQEPYRGHNGSNLVGHISSCVPPALAQRGWR